MRLSWLLNSSETARHRATRSAARHGACSTDRRRLRLEPLESRHMLSATFPGVVLPTYVHDAVIPSAVGGPTGFTPAQIRAAYGFSSIPLDGSGTTIAIVAAQDNPNIANDLKQFDAQFGLPDPVFVKVNQFGATNGMPAADPGWATEIALDVEWAHAIAPGAKILLVEANSALMSDLMVAVNTARSTAGVVAVSMSWGGGEFSGESFYDSYFTTPAGHNGVTFVASSGDSGSPASYPAASPNVVSVGGTSLFLSGGGYGSESSWSGSGGGVSSVEVQPAYQNGIVSQSTTRRATPDVAYDSNPSTGFPVFDTFGGSGWSQYGGTSDAAPQWAALVAIADEGRANIGLSSLDGPSQTLPMLYAMPASNFHDITTGSSTGSPSLKAGAGYDLVTGRGTPLANLVIPSLVGGAIAFTATHFSVTTSADPIAAGQSFSITVSALDGNNSVFPNYTGTVHLASSDGRAVLPLDHTFTAADNGVYVFTDATLFTAGSATVTATDTQNGTLTETANETVVPAAADHLAFAQQPASAVAGGTISPVVTVQVLDSYGNLLTGDSTDTVSIALVANPTGATLGGTTTVTTSGGTASFGNLSINNVGDGYALQATSVALTAATSTAFNAVAAQPPATIESFNKGSLSNYHRVGTSRSSISIVAKAAHNGGYGLATTSNTNWYYRNDAAAQVKQGDTVSVWVRFASATVGKTFFGFGAGPNGTLSLVASRNTGQLILQDNVGFGYQQLAAVNQKWRANHWYRLEVNWGASGQIVGKLYDSNGVTLLNTVTGTDTSITAGGIAVRATGATTYWDTVTLTRGVNAFTVPALADRVTGRPSAGSQMASPNAASSIAWVAISPSPGTGTSGNVSLNRILDDLFGDLRFIKTLF